MSPLGALGPFSFDSHVCDRYHCRRYINANIVIESCYGEIFVSNVGDAYVGFGIGEISI